MTRLPTQADIEQVAGKKCMWVTGALSSAAQATTPHIVNMSVADNTWTKLADLPNDCVSWTVKSKDNNFLFRFNFDGGATYITANAGIIWSEDTNPTQIWVWQNTGVSKDFELIYWTP